MEEQQLAASVVVAVYNSQETVGECVRSLLNLDYPAAEHELICVDNGSTDASGGILESFGGRIRVLREPKRGASAARNRGIRSARFPVVAFTDSDCAVDPQWLRHLVAPLKDPETGVSGGTILSRRPCNRVEAFGETVHNNCKAITYFKPPYSDSANWASRREVLLRLGCFDEAFLRAQDVELSCRILQAGLKLVHAPEAIVYHRNERTYGGLFREGFTHGMHSVALMERHRSFYESYGYRPRRLSQYRNLWAQFREYLSGKNPESAGCQVVFNGGKRLGRLAGSMRFGAVHL
jgi:glycosyltransferase involved in cell wall biosynthesis